jgi:dTDP-4-dehydrorhamnose 3,5-epimerase
MGSLSLDDILITPLSRIPTVGGDVLHAVKKSDVGYSDFGEAYLSWVDGGATKGWKRHTKMIMNIIVPVGQVKFVFHLNGTEKFRDESIGVDRYVRITVLPGIWFGFQGLTKSQSLVLNIASIAHDPNEVESLELSEIKYNWS